MENKKGNYDFVSHSSVFFSTIARYKVRIVKYKVAIARYKVRIVRYKVRIA